MKSVGASIVTKSHGAFSTQIKKEDEQCKSNHDAVTAESANVSSSPSPNKSKTESMENELLHCEISNGVTTKAETYITGNNKISEAETPTVQNVSPCITYDGATTNSETCIADYNQSVITGKLAILCT